MKYLLGVVVLALVLALSPASAYYYSDPTLTSSEEAKPFGTPSSPNSEENLPTIIENDQQAQPQPQLQPQEAQQEQPSSSSALVAPSMLQDSAANGNSSLPASTSRTIGEGWTACSGTSGGKYGTCKNDVNCKKDKGIPDGSCMGGLGVCCVMSLSCGDKSHENNTFFANQDFPEPNWEARLCEVEIKKKHSSISQIMIEFEEFELAPPNHEGECVTDVFQVKLASGRPSPYSQLRLCGQNTGQHMYLDVSQIEEPLVLSVATSGGGFPRRYSIRIVQMDDKNYLLAPPGCLQYYTDTIGHFRSFNLGQNLRNLYYAICFRIDHGYSGIRFSSNFFGMNGHQCRKQKPHSVGPHGVPGRLGNSSYEAPHPHHLVNQPPPPGYPIPPPGYAVPPPGYATSQVKPRHLQHNPPPPPPPQSYGPSYGPNYGPNYGPSYGSGHGPGYGPNYGPNYGPGYGPPHQPYPHHEGKKEWKDEKWENKKEWKDGKWEDKKEWKDGKWESKKEYKDYKEDKWEDKKEWKNGKWEDKKDEKWWSLWNKKEDKKDKKDKFFTHHEALFPMMHIPEMPHCEPRYCGANDVITFPPSGDSISEMCGNRFNIGRGPKIVSGSPLVVYVSNRGHNRGAGFDLNYEQVFYVPKPYK